MTIFVETAQPTVKTIEWPYNYCSRLCGTESPEELHRFAKMFLSLNKSWYVKPVKGVAGYYKITRNKQLNCHNVGVKTIDKEGMDKMLAGADHEDNIYLDHKGHRHINRREYLYPAGIKSTSEKSAKTPSSIAPEDRHQ